MQVTQVEIGTGLIVLFVILGICLVVFLYFAVRWVIVAHQRQVAAGKEELVGRTAVVMEALNPKGTVFIEGERWTAESEGGRMKVGDEVTITKVESLKLYVTKKE